MCQLLGMNCNTPTDICFSFAGFRTRGGQTDEHKDGWGISFFEGRGCRSFIDVQQASDSPIADMVRQYPIHSTNVISHIRKATQGRVALENTHPFQRELWGRHWVFAHNGDLKDFYPKLVGPYQAVGDTDSERAFCYLLHYLRNEFASAPSPERMFPVLRELAGRIAAHGEFNFLLSNGDFLFAHCGKKLTYLVRQAPFTTAHLTDQDISIDFNEVARPGDRIAVVATQPLTDNEAWTAFDDRTLNLFVDGQLVMSAPTTA
ncbi:MAG TPA: class II glutamine amidotransferase [Rhodocyclaceae bacterium]|nr:class II glutamine amidotransferase [Rhodocyclaceae bacterium]